MKHKSLINILLCAIILFVNLPLYSSAEEISAEYVPGEIVITTKEPIVDTSSTFTTLSLDSCTPVDFEDNGIEHVEELDYQEDITDETTYVAQIDGDVVDICKELEKLPNVEHAEPNYIFHTMGFTMPGEVAIPTSLYAQHQKWYFDYMNIPSAWQEYEVTGDGVVIAIIDNGYKINATEFPTNLWTDGNGNHGWNTFKNSADISPIYKSDGTAFKNTSHGSNVAGIIGMKANYASTVGAAYGAQLMLINAAAYIDDSTLPGFTIDDLVEAIDYARINGADIINMSLGGTGNAAILESAVDRAYDAGIAVLAAAGNSKMSTTSAPNIPAAYDNVIGVMAIDKTDTSQLSNFSNYDPSNKYYDVAAPGVEIIGCSHEIGKVTAMNGTSQATPLVAACAALYLEAYPDSTVEELYDAIRNSPTRQVTTNPTVTDSIHYFKVLNAVELLDYGKVKPELNTNLLTSVTKDEARGYIYGLDEGYESIYDYITITEGTGTTEVILTENGNGSGTIFNVYDIYGELYKSYILVIFGDTNGDAVADGQDAVITSFIIDNPSKFSEHIKFAADVDFDDYVTQADYSITANYAIGKDFVFQTR